MTTNKSIYYAVYNFDNGLKKDEATLKFISHEEEITAFDLDPRALDVLCEEGILADKENYKEEIYKMINEEDSEERLRYDEQTYIDNPDVKNFNSFIELSIESDLNFHKEQNNFYSEKDRLAELSNQGKVELSDITISTWEANIEANKFLKKHNLQSSDIRKLWDDEITGTRLENAHVFAQESINQILVNDQDFRDGLESLNKPNEKKLFIKNSLDELQLKATDGNSLRLQPTQHRMVLDSINEDGLKGRVKQEDGILKVKNDLPEARRDQTKTIQLINEKDNYIQLSRLQTEVEKLNKDHKQEQDKIEDNFNQEVGNQINKTDRDKIISEVKSFDGDFNGFKDHLTKIENFSNKTKLEKYLENEGQTQLEELFEKTTHNKQEKGLKLDQIHTNLQKREVKVKTKLNEEEVEFLKENIDALLESDYEFTLQVGERTFIKDNFENEDCFEDFINSTNDLLNKEPTKENRNERQQLAADIQKLLPNQELEEERNKTKQITHLKILEKIEDEKEDFLDEDYAEAEAEAKALKKVERRLNRRGTDKDKEIFDKIKISLEVESLEDVRERFENNDFSKKEKQEVEITDEDFKEFVERVDQEIELLQGKNVLTYEEAAEFALDWVEYSDDEKDKKLLDKVKGFDSFKEASESVKEQEAEEKVIKRSRKRDDYER